MVWQVLPGRVGTLHVHKRIGLVSFVKEVIKPNASGYGTRKQAIKINNQYIYIYISDI